MQISLPPEKVALDRAAKVLGGQAAMAKLLGYKDRRGVWPYFHTDRPFPSEHCPTVERATREKGEPVLCEHLRPDVDWGVLRTNAASHEETSEPPAGKTGVPPPPGSACGPPA